MHRQIAGVLTGRRTKWIALAIWIIALMVLGPLAGKFTGVQDNETSSWLPESAESTKVLDEFDTFGDPDVVPAVIVYERSDGITAADRQVVEDQMAEIAGIEHVTGEPDGPIPSEDGRALQVIAPVDMGDGGWDTLGEVTPEIREVTGQTGDGLSAYVTGPAGVSGDFADVFDGMDGTLLLAAVSVAVLLLLLTYRSPVLWLLPVVTAGVALISAQGVVYLLANADVFTVNAQSAGILTVLVFGAGTDYALLLVARYREELRRHEDRHVAMALALHRAGPAVFASGTTVLLGMLCLVFAELNSTAGMGPVLAVGVAVGMLAMMSLLPALLVIFGRWVFWPLIPRYGSPDHTADGIWAKLGRTISVRPRATWIGTSLVLGALALGMTQLDAEGLTNEEALIDRPESIVGQEVVAEHFPAGAGQPVYVIANAGQADAVTEAVSTTPGIADVSPGGEAAGRVLISAELDVPGDSAAGRDVVEDVRASVHAVDGADAIVGGDTAVILDTLDAAAKDNVLIIPIVLVVVFVILAVLLRALIAPLVLVGTVVLSFGASMGVCALVFEHVFGFDGADAGFPLFVFVFLVALGIDYNIFLMTGVREESLKYGMRRGALIGLAATGGVITSAGLVLAGTFGAMLTMPMVFMVELGFAVAFGVLLDTIIVRSVLVTALNLDIGRHMWWPSALGEKEDVEETPSEPSEVLVR
ncbi:MMPL family transporter [Solicola gregarius]|uniref:MMPL family transporter n=1 Tax=Solicola gregarius TaxID=2908642 RepID=A0AA46TFJ6_9ACTN|nr:MMPL family transporter [Solicola gregarius]UYM04396.1 MMPL family transporter [Solicola gregarius]